MDTFPEINVDIIMRDPMDGQNHSAPGALRVYHTSSLGICQGQALASEAVAWWLLKPYLVLLILLLRHGGFLLLNGALVLLNGSLETQ